MSDTFFVADHHINDYLGGAELADHTIYTRLGVPFMKSHVVNSRAIDPNALYIISNAVYLHREHKAELMRHRNYLILEHDYKIHPSRQPHRYKDNIFPKDELINLQFYENAQVVFLQSNDHLECFEDNEIQGNLRALQGSVWSEEELTTLRSLTNDTKTHKYAIIGNKSTDKGSDVAIAFCTEQGLDYEIIQTKSLLDFYKDLSTYSTLVYFPRVKESFCRLVVEARCLQLNVITNRTYGAVKEPWFSKKGLDMLDFLEACTVDNIERIKAFIK